MIRLEVEIPQRYRMGFDKKNVRAALLSAGSEIASVARRKIRQAVGGGRVYHGKGGRHQASLPGQPPANWKGTLADSIKARPFQNGDGVLIKDAAFYALFLEAGARGGVGSGKRGIKGRRNAIQRRGGVRTILPTGNRVLAPRPFLSASLAERSASLTPRIKDAVVKDLKFQRVSASAKL